MCKNDGTPLVPKWRPVEVASKGLGLKVDITAEPTGTVRLTLARPNNAAKSQNRLPCPRSASGFSVIRRIPSPADQAFVDFGIPSAILRKRTSYKDVSRNEFSVALPGPLLKSLSRTSVKSALTSLPSPEGEILIWSRICRLLFSVSAVLIPFNASITPWAAPKRTIRKPIPATAVRADS